MAMTITIPDEVGLYLVGTVLSAWLKETDRGADLTVNMTDGEQFFNVWGKAPEGVTELSVPKAGSVVLLKVRAYQDKQTGRLRYSLLAVNPLGALSATCKLIDMAGRMPTPKERTA